MLWPCAAECSRDRERARHDLRKRVRRQRFAMPHDGGLSGDRFAVQRKHLYAGHVRRGECFIRHDVYGGRQLHGRRLHLQWRRNLSRSLHEPHARVCAAALFHRLVLRNGLRLCPRPGWDVMRCLECLQKRQLRADTLMRKKGRRQLTHELTTRFRSTA